MNVFCELVHSIYDCKSYETFFKDRKRKTFLFGFLLVVIYFLLTMIVPFVRFQMSTGGIVKIVDEVVPDFAIADGRLDVEEQFEFAEGDTYFFVDTKDEAMTEEMILENLRRYGTVLIADSENLIVKSNGQVQTLQIADLDIEITKSEIITMFRPFVNLAIGIILVIVFLFMQATFFFGVIFVALFGMIVASCMQTKLTFGELYKLGIYTRTTPLLIKALLSFLPFGLPFFWIISLGISLGYLAGAMRSMNTQDLGGQPVVFHSEESALEDRWKRPEEDYNHWNDTGDKQN
ncbi:MAG: DUF1189 domain-containing protein [Lachnospiraceae bacterium]|nr:DUF1189 domain-containing protein [Lachnospiraceae bacterium]MCI9282337.1 DUF1189 domain-containing protein [Lachnospiraceae bacterium]